MKDITAGQVVTVYTQFNGCYIGQVLNTTKSIVSNSLMDIARVRIMSVISYPKQYAELYTDKPVERLPYQKNRIVNIPFECLGQYVGSVPSYGFSLKQSLSMAKKHAKKVELPLLEKHSMETTAKLIS